MARIELPSGGWAELRDLAERPVTYGERRPLQVLALTAGRDEDPAAVIVWREGILRLLVQAWSFGAPPGTDPTAFDNVPAHDVDALIIATDDMKDELFLSTELTEDAIKDPNSPKGSSSESNGSSPEATPTPLSLSPPSTAITS